MPIVKDMPQSEYLALPRVSNSYLTRLAKTPAHAKIRTESTPAMALGTATHTYILEHDKFTDTVTVAPKMDRRTKAGKLAYLQFLTESEGKTVISADELNAIKGMGESVKSHPMASELLSVGDVESSLLWDDDKTGLPCKARPDWLTPDGIIVDLKTTRNASQHGFLQSVLNFRYFQQAAFYLEGMDYVSDLEYSRFIFIAVETERPYRVACYELSDEFINYGRRECRRLLSLENKCRGLDFYPNYNDANIVMLDKPFYLK